MLSQLQGTVALADAQADDHVPHRPAALVGEYRRSGRVDFVARWGNLDGLHGPAGDGRVDFAACWDGLHGPAGDT